MRSHGFTRRELRAGGGRGQDTADDHFGEMIGSHELFVYRQRSAKIKGYEALKSFLESHGCQVVRTSDAPNPVGQGVETIRITYNGQQIPVPHLRRAHQWAHQRNLLHLFHKKT